MRKLRIEFLSSHIGLLICGGDDGCGSAVLSAEAHLKWHEKMFPYDVPLPKSGSTITGK